MNTQNVIRRQEKYLNNYDRFQKAWHKNLVNAMNARNRLNKPDCASYKQNLQQFKSFQGDLTLLDRVDMSLEKIRDRELLNVTMPQSCDYGVNWMCSLR